MNAYGYARVSTLQQARDDRLGLSRQREAIERYAKTFGYDLSTIFSDAVTGTAPTREGLTSLKDALGRKPGTVIIGETRAMARDLTVMFQTLSDLQGLGAPIHSADMGLIDLSDEGSVIQFTTRAMMDHSERLRVSKRTYQSKVAMAEQGRLPSGMQMQGYDMVSGIPVVREDEAHIVRLIFEMASSGSSVRSIAEELNARGYPTARNGVWGKTTVARILRNPAYRGEAVWTQKQGRRKRYTFPVPALVSEAQWYAAQPKPRGRPPALNLPLAGHIYCARCGASMSPQNSRGRLYYRCNSRNLKGREPCGAPMVPAEPIATEVEKGLRELLSDPEQVRAYLLAARDDEDTAAELEDLERQDKEALELWRAGVLSADEFRAVRSDVATRRGNLSRAADVDPLPYVKKAKTLPLEELLDYVGARIFASRDEVRIDFG